MTRKDAYERRRMGRADPFVVPPVARCPTCGINATAHDDLLAACEAMLSGLMMDYPTVAIGMNDWPPVVAARAAIAKARGRGEEPRP